MCLSLSTLLGTVLGPGNVQLGGPDLRGQVSTTHYPGVSMCEVPMRGLVVHLQGLGEDALCRCSRRPLAVAKGRAAVE